MCTIRASDDQCVPATAFLRGIVPRATPALEETNCHYLGTGSNSNSSVLTALLASRSIPPPSPPFKLGGRASKEPKQQEHADADAENTSGSQGGKT
jgi:hypothetical protein